MAFADIVARPKMDGAAATVHHAASLPLTVCWRSFEPWAIVQILSLSKGLSDRADKGSFDDLPPVSHTLVRRHPTTGRHSLLLSPHTMVRVEGMAEVESRAPLDALIAHALEDRFVYRHQW